MITAADYEFLCRLLKARSGLVLAEDKHYLLESRLVPVAQRFGLATVTQLAAKLRAAGAAQVEEAVVEAMTTNESFFFRDKVPFDAFTATMLPGLLRKRPPTQPLRIWCAAASTGQEPYSLAMLLRENGALVAGRRIELLATDLSKDVLEKARDGIYSQFEVQRGLPVQYLMKYFRKAGENWQIAPEIRSMVTFRPLNLLGSFAALGRFDIVFCRNVLIYFDAATKLDILQRLAKVIAADGYLVLGGAETVVGLTSAFQPVAGQRSLYAPRISMPADAPVAAPLPLVSPILVT